jgi:hypothetical protein
MTHAHARTIVLHLAADNPDISSATIKRSLDLLAFFEIEELELSSATSDEWGSVLFSFAQAELPQLVVSGYDVTAISENPEDAVAKLVNAITCAYEADDADDLGDDDEVDEDDDD